MRNPDPRMRTVFTHRPDSDFNSMFPVQITGRDFQYGSNSCTISAKMITVTNRKNRKQYGRRKITVITGVTVVTDIKNWHWQDHGRMLEVHISKHSLFRLKITVGCLTSTHPSIHFFVSRSRPVVDCAHIQAFTLKFPQDRGRLTGERISEPFTSLLTKTLSRSWSVA